MTTQLNQHQQVLFDFITVSIGVFSQAAKGHVDLTNMVEIGKAMDLDKLSEAMGWLAKVEVRG